MMTETLYNGASRSSVLNWVFMEVSAVEPIRQVIDNMPEILSVPPEVRHQRVEIVFRLLQQKTVEGSFKEALGAMPDIGDDDDFARPRDFGRGEMQWDI
jgi:hypothetical protein